MAPTQSIRVTEGTLGNNMSTAQLLHSSAVQNEKAVLGSRWEPIEIPDSPIREKAPYQHDQTQRTKRARDENSDVEVCSDPSNNTKKAKLLHQPQNQTINSSQNERELPLLQTDLNIPICLSALENDYKHFEEKELLFVVSPARAMTKEGFNDFFYEGESIHDFIGMKDYRMHKEGADGFCHEISVDDFISVEDLGVEEINSDDGCWYEKKSSDDFSDLEQYFWGQPESLDDIFKEGEC